MVSRSLFLALCASSAQLGLAGDRASSPTQPPVAQLAPANPADPLESARLVDQLGRQCLWRDFRGKTVLAHFVFTRCPAACPAQVEELKKLRASLPPEVAARVHFVSISIDPEHDTPEALRAFAGKMGIDTAHWSLLGGKRENLVEVARVLGDRSAYKKPATANDLPHDLNLYLFDATGRLRQTYPGTAMDAVRLRDEITTVDRLFNPR